MRNNQNPPAMSITAAIQGFALAASTVMRKSEIVVPSVALTLR
jgi:hypothetical protein